VLGCPVVTSDHVLAGSYDRHLYAVEKESGEERWRVETGIGSPARRWSPTTPSTLPRVRPRSTSGEGDVDGDDGDSGDGPTGALYRIVADE